MSTRSLRFSGFCELLILHISQKRRERCWNVEWDNAHCAVAVWQCDSCRDSRTRWVLPVGLDGHAATLLPRVRMHEGVKQSFMSVCLSVQWKKFKSEYRHCKKVTYVYLDCSWIKLVCHKLCLYNIYKKATRFLQPIATEIAIVQHSTNLATELSDSRQLLSEIM